MTNYDIYVRAITEIGKSMPLPITVMSRDEFTARVAAAERGESYPHTSLINMDAFEAAVR